MGVCVLWLNITMLQDKDGKQKLGGVAIIYGTSPSENRTEEALENSESRYRELFNNSKNAIVIYEAIDDGRDFIFKEFNHAAENIEQLKKEALIGKFLTEAFTWCQRVWPAGGITACMENRKT